MEFVLRGEDAEIAERLDVKTKYQLSCSIISVCFMR